MYWHRRPPNHFTLQAEVNLSKIKACSNFATGTGLVSTSVRLSLVEIFSTSICCCAIMSLTKRRRTSICLVLSWNALFLDRCMALYESHKTLGTQSFTPSSLVNPCNQTASLMASVKATYTQPRLWIEQLYAVGLISSSPSFLQQWTHNLWENFFYPDLLHS